MQVKICTIILMTVISAALQTALADEPTTMNPNNFFAGFNPKTATVIVQAGGFNATQGGGTQNIGINGLIGDQFTVSNTHGDSFIFGLGYYANGQHFNNVQMLYGLNAFYLAPTIVRGNVIQEEIFNNLSYSYAISNYPVYLAARAVIDSNDIYNVTADLGIGPNFISTSHFTENSLDGGITQPDNIFSGATSVAFSATAGFGIQFKNVFGSLPLEFDYRFFYLGEGQLHSQTDQVLNTLKTGDNYANAIMISTSF